MYAARFPLAAGASGGVGDAARRVGLVRRGSALGF